MKLFCLIVFGVISVSAALPYTMPANPNPYVEVNADGSTTPEIHLFGRGESGGYGETIEVTVSGYPVERIQGNYEYTEFDDTSGAIFSTGVVAKKGDDPSKITSKKSGKKLARYQKGQEKTHKGKIAKGDSDAKEAQRKLIAPIEEANGIPREHSHVARRRAAVLGTKVNLIVPFKFADHVSRSVPSVADLTILMNNQGPHTLCPTGSVRDVYLSSSYGKLILTTTVAPWVVVPKTEAYYAGGNSGIGTTVVQQAIGDALDALQATGFDFTQFDKDNDGYIDAIGFLHSGYGAEFGGTDAYGGYYTNRIWSHKWAVYSLASGKWTSTSGKSVYNYHISPSLWGTSGTTIGRIGAIAHETGHFFGMPDLYDGSVGSGIGSFCLMANAWGFDGSQKYPPHFSPWAKIQLGWVTPTLITTAGTYTARQACNNSDVFQISANFPSGEYLLIENRQACQFDSMIQGPGLAIFHIDESAGDTTEGYPGQTGWPTNAQHYRVALLQADGSYNLEMGANKGDATDLFYGGGVSGITSKGTSAGKAYPNTKAYKGGVILDTGVAIQSISASSSTMTFSVSLTGAAPTMAPTFAPANQLNFKMLTDGYASSDNSWTLYQTSTTPNVLIASKAVGAYVNYKLYNEYYTLGPGTYQFSLNDAYGDGLGGGGYYTLSLGGVVLRTLSGAFSTDTTTFSVAASIQPVTAKPITAKPVSAAPITSKPITSTPVIAPVPMLQPKKPIKPTKPSKPIKPAKPLKPLPSKPKKPM